MIRALVLAVALPVVAWAHPLGNFTTNRLVTLSIGADNASVGYVVDVAEIPSYRTLAEIDTDGDGTAARAELDRWARRLAERIIADLAVTRDDTPLTLDVDHAAAAVVPGAGDLPTVRADLRFVASPGAGTGAYTVRDDNFAGLPGWHEILVATDGPVHVTTSTAVRRDRTNGLREYPDDALALPPQMRTAHVQVAAGTAPVSAGQDDVASTLASRHDRLTALIMDRQPLTLGVVVAGLALAMMLGAFHALTPGHGKTIVGAYLVGTRGTWQHAVFLGLVVTLTHTAGVFVLGLGTLAASAWILPERLLPWLSAVSGLLVVAVGATLVRQRLEAALHPHGHDDHDHHHHDGHAHAHGHGGHSHLPPARTPVTMRSLAALGISGGLVPCPSALVVMLGSIAAGRTAFGLALTLAFSTGLAAVLTAIGLALVYTRGLFDQLPLDGRFARFMPVASAVVISLAGLTLLVEAITRMGT